MKREHSEENEITQPDNKALRIETPAAESNSIITSIPLSLESALQADKIEMQEFLSYLILSKEDERPVQQIISRGGINTIKFLLDHDLNLLSQDFIELNHDNSLYPLDHALSEGEEDIALLLINRGAAVENFFDDTDIQPVSAAAANGFLKVLKLLHEKGAHVKANDISLSEVDIEPVKLFQYFQDAPLYQAVNNGHIEVVKYLLSVGAEISGLGKVKKNIDLMELPSVKDNETLAKILKLCKLVDDFYNIETVEITTENFDLYSDLANDPTIRETFLTRIESFVKDKAYDNVRELQHKLMNFEKNINSVMEDVNIDLSFLKSDKLKSLSHEGGVLKLFNLTAFAIYNKNLHTSDEVSVKTNQDITNNIESLFKFISLNNQDTQTLAMDTSGNNNNFEFNNEEIG